MKGRKKTIAENVDQYIAAFPADVRALLQNVRKAIRETAPGAEEMISYQVPGYKYKGPLVYFAAFKDHCSLYGISDAVFSTFEKELKPFEISGKTIHFTPAKPLPATLIKKIVQLRIKENEERNMLKGAKKTTSKAGKKTKPAAIKPGNVDEWMGKLDHPLKEEIEAVRKIIRNSSDKISERIKWNAPSYYITEGGIDLVTFNCRPNDHVHLVFHHPLIVKIRSSLLEGDYKDRRMMYMKDMKAVKTNKKELQEIIKELVSLASKNK